MALAEEQIIRYSRQILLAQVGGAGQERLLGTRVRVVGRGAAQATAVAYLAAGGCAVEEQERPVLHSERGSLYWHDDTGADAARRLEQRVKAHNPDAVPRSGEFETHGCLAELPARFEGPGPWVALGAYEGRAAVVYRSAIGCAACFEVSVRPLAPLESGPLPELLGALAALLLQRMVLGLGEPLGGQWVDDRARLEPFPLQHCVGCRA